MKNFFFAIKKHHDPWVPFLKLSTKVIIFSKFLIFYQIFISLRVTRSVIVGKINGIYELLNGFRLRIWDLLENFRKISKQHGISVHSSSQNKSFVSTSKKLLITRYWTFPEVRYFTWNLKFFANILSFVVDTRSWGVRCWSFPRHKQVCLIRHK